MSYLVDINLPAGFEYFEKDNFLFIKDISDTFPDTEIWKMALETEQPPSKKVGWKHRAKPS